MGKLKKNEDILSRFGEYQQYLAARKTVGSPLTPAVKDNHPSSSYAEERVSGGEFFDSSCLSVEIKHQVQSDFSFQLLGDSTRGRVLCRYDMLHDAAMHRNNVWYIPLDQQQVGYPHFHQYDDKGYFIACQSDPLDPSSATSELIQGFEFFCRKYHIVADDNGNIPPIQWIPPTLDLNFGDDPNEGTDFPR